MTPSTTMTNHKTIQLGTSPLLFAAAPRRAIATTTTCSFRGPTLTPRHHHYLPHNLNPHGRRHKHQLHPLFPRHNHRHTLTHNHNLFNHHRCCPPLYRHCTDLRHTIHLDFCPPMSRATATHTSNSSVSDSSISPVLPVATTSTHAAG